MLAREGSCRDVVRKSTMIQLPRDTARAGNEQPKVGRLEKENTAESLKSMGQHPTATGTATATPASAHAAHTGCQQRSTSMNQRTLLKVRDSEGEL